MTVTNHALTGAIIALLVPQPALAIVLAVVSHFVLDAVPHFGGVSWYEKWGKPMMCLALADATFLCMSLAWLWVVFPAQYWLVVACAIAATVPDWLWGLYYLNIGAKSMYFRFHLAIQRWERPWGAYVEIGYAAGAVVVLSTLAAL